jgi:hypothetical protein
MHKFTIIPGWEIDLESKNMPRQPLTTQQKVTALIVGIALLILFEFFFLQTDVGYYWGCGANC